MAGIVTCMIVGWLVSARGTRILMISIGFVVGVFLTNVQEQQLWGETMPAQADTTTQPTDDLEESMVLVSPPDELVKKAEFWALKVGVDPTLYKSLIKQESNWNPKAESHAGARGLGQVMPFNAEFCGLSEDDLWDADKNLRCSLKILKAEIDYWQQKFPYDPDAVIRHALGSYNAGRPAVEKKNALVRYTETRNYVAIITKNYYKNLFKSSLTIMPAPKPSAQVVGECASRDCLKLRAGATGRGESKPGVWEIAFFIQNHFDVKEFTALNDNFHKSGMHPKGCALDFTLTDKTQYRQVVTGIVEKLEGLGLTASELVSGTETALLESGVDVVVLDEYSHPSKKSTGPHIHVSINADASTKIASILSTQNTLQLAQNWTK